MKKLLLGTTVILALLTGCTEEKKAPVETESITNIPATVEVKKDDTAIVTPTNEEIEKEESMPVLLTPSDEEIEKDEIAPKEGDEELPVQDEEPVQPEQGK